MNPVPDTELQAFARLVELHHAAVHAVAYAITRDVTVADDVAQQTLVAAWTARGTLRDLAKVRPWLCGIARNQSHKALRRSRREHLAKGVIVATLASDQDTQDTRDALLAQETERHVQRALAAMPARYREPLVLFYWEDQSIAHVAATLAITEQAAQKRISRGREYLREGLATFETDLAAVGRRRRAASAAAAAVLAAIGMRPASAHGASIAPRASYVAHGLRTLVACGVGAVVMYAVLVPREVPACPPPPPPAAAVASEDLERQLQQLRRDVVRIQFEDNEAHDELRANVTADVKPERAASDNHVASANHVASKQIAIAEPSQVATEPAVAEPAATVAPPPVELVATCARLDCILAGPSNATDGPAQCCKAVMSHFQRVSSGVAGISKLQPDAVVGDENEVCKLVRAPGATTTELRCGAKAASEAELIGRCSVLMCVGGKPWSQTPCCNAVLAHTRRVSTGVHGISRTELDAFVGGDEKANRDACELVKRPGKTEPELTCHTPPPDQLGEIWP